MCHTIVVMVLASCAACTPGVTEVTDKDDCNSYLNESAPSGATVHIHNKRTEPVFVYSACSGAGYWIRDIDDELWRVDKTIRPLCSEAQAPDWQSAGGDCGITAIRIEPGAVYENTWDGHVYEDLEMPRACMSVSEDSETITCARRVALSGQLLFTASGYPDCDGEYICGCMQPTGSPGSCIVGGGMGSHLTGEPTNATASLTYGSETVVDLVFD